MIMSYLRELIKMNDVQSDRIKKVVPIVSDIPMLITRKNEKSDHRESMEMGLEEKEIELLHREKEKYQRLYSGLYEDWKDGIITEDEYYSFRRIYENEIASIKETIEKQEKHLHRSSGTINILEYRNLLNNPNRMLFLSFLEQVEVNEIPESRTLGINVKYNFCLL
jgi:hypothetical protein